jgi:hypothetical protein
MSTTPARPVREEKASAGGRPARMSVRGAAFIGVELRVGASIFALLGFLLVSIAHLRVMEETRARP